MQQYRQLIRMIKRRAKRFHSSEDFIQDCLLAILDKQKSIDNALADVIGTHKAIKSVLNKYEKSTTKHKNSFSMDPELISEMFCEEDKIVSAPEQSGKGKVKLNCTHCKKEFERYFCHIKKSTNLFCSVKCKNRFMLGNKNN